MPLTAKEINKTKPTDEEQWIKVAEGSGCYLVVSKSAKAKKIFAKYSLLIHFYS